MLHNVQTMLTRRWLGTFLVSAHWFGIPFPKLETFSGIFWVLPIDYSLYEKKKNNTRNFCLFVYLQSYNNKSKILVFTANAVKPQHVLFANEPFFREMLILFFGSNIPLCIEKNHMEKLCNVLEMERKTSPQNSFPRK